MGRNKKFKRRERNCVFSNSRRGYGQSSSRTDRTYLADHKQDQDNTEIPGFYFDRETKSYFRITPENSKYFKEKIRAAHEKSSVTTSPTKHGHHKRDFCKTNSVTCEIIGREYQISNNSAFCKNVAITRLKMMKEVCCTQSENRDFIPISCQIMVGNPNCGSVVGAWTTPDGTVIYNHLFQNQQKSGVSLNVESSIVGIYFKHVMTDLCVAKISDGLECVLYVGNPARPSAEAFSNRSTMHLYPVNQLCDLSTPEGRFAVDSTTLNMEQSESTLWSCAWNQNMQNFAFGCEGSVMLMSLQNNMNTKANLAIPKENGFSVEFDKTGNMLYCGTNKGSLKGFDLRTKKPVLNIKLNRGLSYLKLLDCNHNIIASSYDHKLIQVDLRTTKAVVEYTGHNNEHLKLPFSISEKNGLLCSVGQDRFTRIWDLNCGDLLYTTPPPAQCGSYHPYVWFSEEWSFRNCHLDTALVVNAGAEFITFLP